VLGAGLASRLDSKVIARGHAIGDLLVSCSSNSSDDIICNFDASG